MLPGVLTRAILALALVPGLEAWTCGQTAVTAVTNITSGADTTLSENYPDNNLGGLDFVNSGTTQNYTRNRALYRFDIANRLPAGSKIISATLTLEVTHEPSAGYNFADFGLHRVLAPWGEGAGVTPPNSGGAGQGAPAQPSEATWIYRFADTTNTWSIPGGGATNDYVATPSALQTIYGLADSPYVFGSSTQLVADVQFWLDHPLSNFGWMLVSQDEVDNFTARRFGSREDTNNAPVLSLVYTPPPRFDSVGLNGQQLSLTFMPLTGVSNSIEFRDTLVGGPWLTLTNFGIVTNSLPLVGTDFISRSQRFYRIVTP